MKLLVQRYSSGPESTLGLLFVEGLWCCYMLEDQEQLRKIYGETRIPAGTYPVGLRTYGRHHLQYLKRFPFHVGMLQIHFVPNFRDILIHIGNDDDDTDGCPLVGDDAHSNVAGRGYVGRSTDAYRRMYPQVAPQLVKGERVSITFIDPE